MAAASKNILFVDMIPPLNVPVSVGAVVTEAIRARTQSVCGFPALLVRPCSDAEEAFDLDPWNMNRRIYAVWWQEGERPRHAGKLELGRLHLLLGGNGGGRLAVPLDEIASVEYRRGELLVTRRNDERVRIGNLDGPGVLLELSDALARAA